MTRDRAFLAPLSAAAAAILVFPSILDNGFVNWDDLGNIVRNAWLGRFDAAAWKWMWTTTHYGHFQPLAWLSLSLDRALWGLNPMGFHLTALILHAAAAAALAATLRALLRAPGLAVVGADEGWRAAAAAAAAVLWAVHPLRVEAVAWATERRELLAALFSLLAARSYLLAVERDPARPALGRAGAWFAAACLSKVTASTLPFILMTLDLWILRRGWRVKEKAGFFLLSAAVLGLGVRAQSIAGASVPFEAFGATDRAAHVLFGPGYYALKTLWPSRLSAFVYVDWLMEPARYWPPALITLFILGLFVLAARRRAGARGLGAALFILLAPSLGFFKSGGQIAADRFAHAPSFAVAAAVAWALACAPRRARAPALGAVCLLALALGAAARAQCLVWRDSVSLWTHAVASCPPTTVILENLASALRLAGREAEASAVYEKLLVEDPPAPSSLSISGDERYQAGDYAAAASLYARALSLNPELPGVRMSLGLAFVRLGRRAEAERAFADSVRQDPHNPEGWHNLGILMAGDGRFDKAEAALKKALRLEPGRANTREALRKLQIARRRK
ncbi:MAG: tetratricopeptide repeat protein [Elusimicrobia bacterium]|nr:tetratricopeptide repeat protein [Elusimicrobiota bacterium]